MVYEFILDETLILGSRRALPIWYKLDVVSAGKNFTQIRKAITAGFFFHDARKDPQEGYRTLVENQPVYIHPSSALFQRQPDWIIYHELVMTTKEYMREVTVIDPKWLVELAPRYRRYMTDTMNQTLGVSILGSKKKSQL
ncbi:probable pre-mRNA-splicing factor ATP-dependent RNA helicase DEAH5 [Rosa chinensis]|uniref:probable pre-mRNA-splicing factor ATP-dependent RNA helicase DEAH5 n=1 Tax=Rosa chinensis TaxID=74649 RepID=UPI000D08B101|nr:probable pre-mRNA-splicing factor ATP-dependent RNA helicase DEAH5 [Rosa chinensis]